MKIMGLLTHFLILWFLMTKEKNYYKTINLIVDHGLRRAFAEGESPVMAVRQASIHLGKLRRINILQANGANAKEAAKAAGVFWKQEAEMLRQARNWRLDDLDKVLDSVNTADVATKTTGSPDQLIAERLLLEISARARRLGL